jgi:hypothetical protein
VREHCPDSGDLSGVHRAVVAELVQTRQASECWHGSRELEHRGCQVFSFYVEVLQIRQSSQLLQAMVGVGPAEQRQCFESWQFCDCR